MNIYLKSVGCRPKKYFRIFKKLFKYFLISTETKKAGEIVGEEGREGWMDGWREGGREGGREGEKGGGRP